MAELKTKDDLSGKEVGNIVVSLSQALLAPMDALFKAQVHAARSFLNLVMQIGYPSNENQPANADGTAQGPQKPFELEFAYTTNDPVNNVPKDYTLKIPQLALVPLNALTIDSAEFKLGLSVTHVDEHTQQQESRDGDKKRPWFLVSTPISLQGNISSHSDSSKNNNTMNTNVDIYVKLSKSSVPAALDNLLTSLTKSTQITQK